MANVSLLATVADQSASQLSGATANIMPTGVILPYGASNAPAGWVLCDGSAVSRTTFANLFAVVGTSFGTGDGSTTFNLPDLRGRFPRFNDNMGSQSISGVPSAGAASRDTGRVLGSAQTQTTAKNGLSNTASSASGSVGGADGGHGHMSRFRTPAGLSISGDDSRYMLLASDTPGGNATPNLSGGGHGHGFSLTAAAQTIIGDTETRPINLAISAIIKI